MNASERGAKEFFALRDQYVTVAGEVAQAVVENDPDPEKIDHVWLTLLAGDLGRVQVSLSTLSRQSRAAGIDPRVRLGIIATAWSSLPAAGVLPAEPCDYATIEAAHPIAFQPVEREELEQLLLEKARRALFAEATGEFYFRSHTGIHQVHSRRGSFALPRDVRGRDGLLRFFYEEQRGETLLFKFAGQP